MNHSAQGIEKGKTDDVLNGTCFSNPYNFAVGAYGSQVYIFCRDAEEAHHFARQLREQNFPEVFIRDSVGEDASRFCEEMYTRRYGKNSNPLEVKA